MSARRRAKPWFRLPLAYYSFMSDSWGGRGFWNPDERPVGDMTWRRWLIDGGELPYSHAQWFTPAEDQWFASYMRGWRDGWRERGGE